MTGEVVGRASVAAEWRARACEL